MQDIAILRTLASYPYVVFSPSLPVHNIMQTLFSVVFDQSHLPYGTSPGTRLSDRARAVLGTMRGPPTSWPMRWKWASGRCDVAGLSGNVMFSSQASQWTLKQFL